MLHKSRKKELEHNSSVSSERFSTSLVLSVGWGVTDGPRAWAELARAAASLRPGWSERCCWVRRRGELGRRFAGLVQRKRWAAKEFGLGWVFSYVFSISNQTNLG